MLCKDLVFFRGKSRQVYYEMTSKTVFSEEQPSEKLNGQLSGIKEEASDDEGVDTGFLTASVSAVKFRKLRNKYLKRNPAIKRFERRYTELGMLEI